MRNHLILGNWNAICDSCGRKFKALDLQKRWDGLMVCKEDYELRHEQDFLRVQKEKITVEFSRPYPTQDTFINDNSWRCTIEGSRALAFTAVAGCAIAGSMSGIPIYTNTSAIAGIAISGNAIAGNLT
jgi:hypothetical protein